MHGTARLGRVVGAPAGLISALAVVAVWVWLFHASLLEMVSIWRRSETFAHGFVVVPIALYLVWRARGRLVGLRPSPAWSVLPVTIVAILIWAAGEVASVASAEHVGVVAILTTSLWLVLGHRITRALAFPLLFLFFAAPFGEFMVPMLMHYTAHFTVLGLRLVQVPVYQEGFTFIVPNGRWSVIEACSGIRYLIASLMVGTLYAYLNYRSLKKRLLFVGVALIVPIVANWLRAFMIVMLGYLSGNTIAVGVDHLIYGWVFFGVVVLAMFWIGSRWQDPDPSFLTRNNWSSPGAVAPVSWLSLSVSLACAATLFVLGHMLVSRLTPVDSGIGLDVSIPAAAGWQAEAGDIDGYRPYFSGYRGDAYQRFGRDGAMIGLYVAAYKHQVQGKELVSWANQLVPFYQPRWTVSDRQSDALGAFPARQARLTADGRQLFVWDWYMMGDHVTDNDIAAKIYLLLERLAGRSDASLHVVVVVPGDNLADARAAAVAFVKGNPGLLARTLRTVQDGT